MFYKIIADTVILIHFLWIVFLFIGAYLGSKYKLIRTFHLLGLGFALITQIFHLYCPLTYLELWLRKKHDPSLIYTGSFIIHYLEKIIYIEIPPLTILLSTILLFLFNGWLYLRKFERFRNLKE